MAFIKAEDLKQGHVLIDPDGHLYEVVRVYDLAGPTIWVWLWLDSEDGPNWTQTFQRGEEIHAISQGSSRESE